MSQELSPETVTPERPAPTLDLAGEVTKLILSSNLNFLYGTTQVVQAVSTLLFTTYIAFLYRVVDAKVSQLVHWGFLVLPAFFWGIATILIFVNTIKCSYRGTSFTVGDLKSTVDAYEEILRRRRQIVMLPAILTLAGLGALVALFLWYVSFLTPVP